MHTKTTRNTSANSKSRIAFEAVARSPDGGTYTCQSLGEESLSLKDGPLGARIHLLGDAHIGAKVVYLKELPFCLLL